MAERHLVHHAERYGTRREQVCPGWTSTNAAAPNGATLNPVSPFYLFVPRDDALEAQYRKFTSIPDVFPVNSVGIVTARDRLDDPLVGGGRVEHRRSLFGNGPGIGPGRLATGQGCARLESYDGAEGLDRESGPTREKNCSRFCTDPLTCATPITPGGHKDLSAGLAPRSCATCWPGRIRR